MLTSSLNTSAHKRTQGHMVPMDQPAAAFDMINRFMRGKDLADSPTQQQHGSGLTLAGNSDSASVAAV
jgi:hypothetical protein